MEFPIELNSEVCTSVAYVSMLYNTVSTDVTCRHGDGTTTTLSVTQRFPLRKTPLRASRWCVTVYYAGALRCAGDATSWEKVCE